MAQELPYVRNSRTMAHNESKDVPAKVKEYAIKERENDNAELNKRISTNNVRVLTEYSGAAPILIDGINLVATKIAMYMKSHNIAAFEDVPGCNYIPETMMYSITMPMEKWLENMLGEFQQYAVKFKNQCYQLDKCGSKIIWESEPVYDNNGIKVAEHVKIIRAPALQVIFKSDGVILSPTQVNEQMKIAQQNNDANAIAKAKLLQKQMQSATALSKSRQSTENSTYMCNTEVTVLFNKTLFKDIIYPNADGSHGFFQTTPHLQLKLMDAIEYVLSSQLFHSYNGGLLSQPRFKLNAITARQILLYLFSHDNGSGDYAFFNIVQMAKAAFPSLVDSRRKTVIDGKEYDGYVAPDDQYTIRGCIEKVCVILGIMLCRGVIDGNLLLPIYDCSRVRLEQKERIRLFRSNAKANYAFSQEQRDQVKAMLLQRVNADVLKPLLLT